MHSTLLEKLRITKSQPKLPYHLMQVDLFKAKLFAEKNKIIHNFLNCNWSIVINDPENVLNTQEMKLIGVQIQFLTNHLHLFESFN